MMRASFPRPIDALLLCAAVAAIATLDARDRLARILPADGPAATRIGAGERIPAIGSLPPGGLAFAADRTVTERR